MREFKILAVLVFFTAITYFGIEPYAHGIMHPHVSEAEYTFKDLESSASAGDAANGKAQFVANCTACHALTSDGIKAPMGKEELISANGVLPPDLSNAGYLFDARYLVNFIQNPANAAFESTYIEHRKAKLADERAKASQGSEEDKKLIAVAEKDIAGFKAKPKISMPSFGWMPEQDIADIVAYLKSVSKEVTPREAATQACGRCHSIKYGKVKENASKEQLIAYLGSYPPDLSQMIRSKGEEYLHNFINDPQKLILGTAMPRVGLTEEAEAKVVEYIENVGDSKKEERNALGWYVILFSALLAVLAYLWRTNIFKEVH